MPLNLDSCIAGIFTPGNIGASSGLPPVQPVVPSLDGTPPTLIELASAIDTLDAFFGEVLHEAVSAADSYSATGGAYEVLVSETASAVDAIYLPQVFNEAVGEVAQATDAPLVYVPGVVSASITEAATAADAPDATVVAGVVPTTLNPADKSSNIILSGGDLTATCNVSTNGGVRSTLSKSAGKVYFEFPLTAMSGGNTGVGIATATASLTVLGNVGLGGALAFPSGSVYFNGSSAAFSIGSPGANISIAVDIPNSLVWFRPSATGQWNGSGTADPATGTGGLNVSALFPTNAVFAVITENNTAANITANFGATAFAQSVPSGFVAWNSA